MIFPPTTTRVIQHTPDHINEEIRRATDERVARCAAAGPAAIEQRLRELDREWDLERALEANASALSLVGLSLGVFVDRRWFLLPAIIAGFLFQHALQGRCPPISVFRRLGVRTSTEIDHERYALKALRGDFKNIEDVQGSDGANIARALQSARA